MAHGGMILATVTIPPSHRHAMTHAAAHSSNASRFEAVKVDHPPTFEDAAWSRSPAVTLGPNTQQIAAGMVVAEPGQARLTYDEAAIYLRVDLTDHDICTTATADGDVLYHSGDVAEWFIGLPVDEDGYRPYLELHVAPNGVRTAYLLARPGLVEPIDPIPFTAEVAVRGTLNAFADRDEGWSAIMTLPWQALRLLQPERDGQPITLANVPPLTMLVARYNYGRHLPWHEGIGGPELTMWPAQPHTSYHLRRHHAPLQLRDAPGPHATTPR